MYIVPVTQMDKLSELIKFLEEKTPKRKSTNTIKYDNTILITKKEFSNFDIYSKRDSF